MPCYHPKKLFQVDTHPSGKPKYLMFPYEVEAVPDMTTGELNYNHIVTSCGRCIGCRLKKSAQWANRAMLEMRYHTSSYFVTLTYDDEHLPPSTYEYLDKETGEYKSLHTLVKEDVQKFMKLLRYYTGQKIRVMYCGEYGDTTFRPHYHLLIFGLELYDLKIYKQNFQGDLLYNSPTIDKAWNHKGYCVVGEANWQTAAYIARYVVKKQYGMTSNVYKEVGIVPPFFHASNRPGIAHQYFVDNYDYFYDYDSISLPDMSGGKTFKPPSYFDKLYEDINPDHMLDIKINRENTASALIEAKLKQYPGLTYEEIMAMEEDNFKERLGLILERSEI